MSRCAGCGCGPQVRRCSSCGSLFPAYVCWLRTVCSDCQREQARTVMPDGQTLIPWDGEWPDDEPPF